MITGAWIAHELPRTSLGRREAGGAPFGLALYFSGVPAIALVVEPLTARCPSRSSHTTRDAAVRFSRDCRSSRSTACAKTGPGRSARK
jgi:hypothetical protein